MKKEIKRKKNQKLTSLAITLIISLVCLTSKVNAECTYNLVEESTKFTLSSGTSTGNSNTYYSSSATYFSGFQTIFHIDSTNNSECHGIFPGQYLIEFYVYSESDFNEKITTDNFTSNFKNINVTTGNLVANEIASQLVDFYQTSYNGKNSYRVLYKFTFDGDYANEFDFTVKTNTNYFYTNSSGIGGYGISYSNIQDYNISIIDSFNADKIKQEELDKLGGIDDSINNNFNSCTQSYNIFDPSGTLYNGKGIGSDGSIITDSTGSYYDLYIKVDPNTTYTLSNKYDESLKGSWFIVYYGSTKNYLSRSQYDSVGNYLTFSTSSNAQYIRLYTFLNLANVNSLENIMIAKGSTKKAFQPYGEICQNKLDQQLSQDKEQHEEFMDSDIPDKDKELPDNSKYQDYTDTENNLKDKVNEADMSVISIGIDSNSSNWVWDTLTRLIQSNSIIFGMFISILSIGIIKLALGR